MHLRPGQWQLQCISSMVLVSPKCPAVGWSWWSQMVCSHNVPLFGMYIHSQKSRHLSLSIQPSCWFVVLICLCIFIARLSSAQAVVILLVRASWSRVLLGVGSSIVPAHTSTRASASCSMVKTGHTLVAAGSRLLPSM